MGKPLSYADFAKAIQVNRASVTMAVKSKTLIPIEGKKQIDPDNPLNKAWIQKQEMKGKEWNVNLIYEKEQPIYARQPIGNITENKSKKTDRVITTEDIRKIEIKQKIANLKKTEKQIKLDEIKIQKQEGALIPFDAVKTVYLFSIETFRNTFIQETNSLANIFVERLGGEHRHFIELQKELTEKINDITKVAKESLISGAKGIVDEFKEVRGRGEHG